MFRRTAARRLASLGLGLALIGGVAAGTALASASPASASTTAPPAVTCPTTPGIPFSGSLSGGTVKIGSALSGSGLTGSACGLVDLASLTYGINASNFTFNPTSVSLFGLLNLPSTITVVGNATGSLSVAPSTSGIAFNTTLPLTVKASVKLLGFTCSVGPFTPTFTTGTSGSLTGSPLAGSSLSTLSGKLVANAFTVPAIQPSATCPGLIASLSNAVIGLPEAAGKSSITSSATFSLQ
jgi:hypothetical protein